MIRFKYRCLLLWCIILTIISIISINAFLVWHHNIKQPIRFFIKFGDVSLKLPMNNENNSINSDYYNQIMFIEQNSTIGTKKNVVFKPRLPFQHYRVDQPFTKSSKLWFMSNGTVRPLENGSYELALWPNEIIDHVTWPMNDRIVNQLMYVPKHYDEENFIPKGKLPLKKILLAYGRHGWNDLELGRKRFIQDKCPVNSCFIMADTNLIDKADAVIFKDRFAWPKRGRPSYDQLWILFLLECPYNTQLFTSLPANVFNWTATYRHDSDIVAPYEKFLSYDSIYKQKPNDLQTNFENKKNFAEGKTKKVAWFVSNCGAKNKRLEYARELSKHIDVDIYGSCGKLKCPRTKAKECFQMLNKDYKFYLAFENSNCRDYITEKFFVNGLGHNFDDLNVIPIVMGAHPDDYLRSAPRNSYIHVEDFQSPAHLANYLHQLDQDDQAYNRYFEWKSKPMKSGEFINTYFWCRLCAMLHASDERRMVKSYPNIAQWWAPKNICNDGRTSRWHNISSSIKSN